MQLVLHYLYQSLTRGENSLFHKLAAAGVAEPLAYVSIATLRTYDLLGSKLVTELIYIHSKLLIVDDEHVIIGSANINDRSQVRKKISDFITVPSNLFFIFKMIFQLGSRDSEVCLHFSGGEREESCLGGKPFQAQKFAKSLRLRLFKVASFTKYHFQEHLGLLETSRIKGHVPESSLEDPCTDSFFFDVWQRIAKQNTKIYEDVSK